MGYRSRPIVFSMVLLSILAFHLVSTLSQEVEDEHGFSYEEGDIHGPKRWGSLREDWRECRDGDFQSPIDLSDSRVVVQSRLGKLRRSYRPSNSSMKNRGHDIELEWKDGAGGIWLNGTEYILHQLHWHSPSEHSINGERFALELHMVHESADSKFAVVGILYKLGRPDPFLSQMEECIHKIKDIENGTETVGMVDPRDIKRGSRKYYRYVGSLTTPPCTEGVVWTIMNKVRTVSKEQVHLLRDAVHDDSELNARPLQPLHSRGVQLYRPQS